jgi:hypothetical protein
MLLIERLEMLYLAWGELPGLTKTSLALGIVATADGYAGNSAWEKPATQSR